MSGSKDGSKSWGYTFLKVAAVAVAGALVAALSSSSAASELGVPFGAQREDKERDDESWDSTFMTVVGAVGAVGAAATVADGLIALLSSTASAASSALQVLIGAPRHNHAPLQEKWKKPEIDWLKLNVDGSREHHQHNGPSAGCGGVLRDSSGKWLLGFSMKLDPTRNQAHNTELQAILMGLKLAREMNVEKLIVESDSESVVSTVANGLGNKVQRSAFSIVQSIKDELRSDPAWQVKLVCVPRKANRVANWLANDARKLPFCDDPLNKYDDIESVRRRAPTCFQIWLEDNEGC